MRGHRPATVGLALTLLLGGPAASAAAEPTGLLASDNVTLLRSIPNPGVIGARFRDGVMYVTSTSGLTTYDIADPANPALLGALPLPHFENEDVDLGGDILLISNDAAESRGILYVIDISDPAAPALLSTTDMGGNPIEAGPGHTASCIQGCRFAWVTDNAGIRVIDLRDPANPVQLGTFETPAGGDVVVHDIQVDFNGLAWAVGFGGAAAYKLPRAYDGKGLGTLVAQTDPSSRSTYFEELGLGDGSNPNDFIHHNSDRVRDAVLITEEDYARPGCRGAGSFQTWDLPTSRGMPTGEDLTLLDMWTTELLADAAAPAAVCSAHYFDVRGNVVAQGWYEQGVRFLDISDPSNIRQIGYFVPPTAATWAAYFAPTDRQGRIVYALDASHGIEVLRFGRPEDIATAPTVAAPVRPEWRTSAPATGLPTVTFGYACRVSA